MRKLGLLIALLVATTLVTAQGNGKFKNLKVSEVSIFGGTTPNPSALLDMQSMSKGILIPRLTTGERDGIGSPATSLLIFNITTNEFNFYNGATWQALAGGGGGSLSSVLATGNSTGANNISIDATQNITYNDGLGGSLVSSSTTGGAKTWTLPDGTGTVALTSDIPAADGNGVFTSGNSGSTVSSAFTINLTDQLNFDGGILGIEGDKFVEGGGSEDFYFGVGISDINANLTGKTLSFHSTNITTGVTDSPNPMDFVIAPGLATGDAVGSDVVIQVARSNNSSGTSQGTLLDVMRFRSHEFTPSSPTVTMFGNLINGDIFEIIGDPSGNADKLLTVGYGGRDTKLTMYANGLAQIFFNGGGDNYIHPKNDGKLSIGFTASAGAKVQIKGNGTTSGTKSFSSLNGSSIEKFFVRDDGMVSATDGYSINGSLFSHINGGVENTYLGINSGTVVTSGTLNTSLGNGSLAATTTGSGNTVMGRAVMLLNVSGSDNTAIGKSALRNCTVSNNTAVGEEALNATSTGGNNTGVGQEALKINTTGGDNVAVGRVSLGSNLSGMSNTAVGHGALNLNSTGSNNVAIGRSALFSNTVSNNLGVGKSAATGVSTGTGITSIGHESLPSLTTGSNITSLGNASGININTTSTKGVFIGSSTGGDVLGVFSDVIAIGHFAKVTGNNQFVVGDDTSPINTYYLGTGVEQVTGSHSGNVTIQPTNITAGSTDISNPTDILITGGKGTGTGTGSSVKIQNSIAGTTGTTQNTLVDVAEFDGSKVAGETRFLLYDVDNGTLERVTVGVADSGGAGFKVLRIPN